MLLKFVIARDKLDAILSSGLPGIKGTLDTINILTASQSTASVQLEVKGCIGSHDNEI